MRKLVNFTDPPTRDYDEFATVAVTVTASEVFYDDGYRIAEEGETVQMSPADAEACEHAGQVVPVQGNMGL